METSGRPAVENVSTLCQYPKRTKFGTSMMGAAEKVVRAAELPVLTVHIGGDEDGGETKGIIYEEDG